MRQKANHEEKWHTLFKKERTTLKIAATMILRRKASTESVLHSALEELEGRPFYEAFGLASALRSVVKAAIAYNQTVTDREDPLPSSAVVTDEADVELPLMKLPWPERAVYFLCEILKYSRRNTALLLGISDTNVDQLKGIAKKRTSFIAPDDFERPTHKLNPVCNAAAAISRT